MKTWIGRKIWLWRAKRSAEAYLPRLTPKDRKIISYLLAKNQSMFTGALDGGHAVTLNSSGFVVGATRPGQVAIEPDVPFAVPEHIWDLLRRHKDEFPYHPAIINGVETHPWRKSWIEE